MGILSTCDENGVYFNDGILSNLNLKCEFSVSNESIRKKPFYRKILGKVERVLIGLYDTR